MRILVIRFRQMGDAIMATPLLNTLRANFPDAEIDFVLNARLAPLFEGHPALTRIITFTDEERHSPLTYIRKVWRTVHPPHSKGCHYDAIIDMRSTFNTMLFALLSPRSRHRIGISKPYTWLAFNHRLPACQADESMVSHNLSMAEPLHEAGREWKVERRLTLAVTNREKSDFHEYMERQGVDFTRPVMLVGVTAKLADKTWPEERMTETLRRLMQQFPEWQLVFNYAPGKEADNARRIYDSLTATFNVQRSTFNIQRSTFNVFLTVEAKSPRELAAMAACCTAYFGNEGGARHIVHAMGRPSLVICSPGASKTTWLPQDGTVVAEGIDGKTYDDITVERVWPKLKQFCEYLSPTIG